MQAGANADGMTHTGPVPHSGDTSSASGWLCHAPSGWIAIALQAALMWLATRIAFALLTYFALLFATSGPHAPGVITTGFASIPPRELLSAWQRWDAVRYLAIAHHGYAVPADASFFPLYPILISVVSFVLGGADQLVVAMLVSNLGSLAAFIGLGLLAAHESPGPAVSDAARAVRVLAAYPFAFLLFAPYADGIFLGLACFGLYCMRRGRWRWAALCVFLATLTRLTGLILIAPLMWEYGQHLGWGRGVSSLPRRGIALGKVVLAALAGPVAVLAFAGYLAARFGQPLAFARSQSLYWEYTQDPLWMTLPSGREGFLVVPGWSYGQLLSITSLALLVGCALYTAVLWRRLPMSLLLYMAGLLIVCIVALFLAPDSFRSPGAYLLAATPLFLLLGQQTARRPSLDMLLLGCGFLLQAALALIWLAGLPPA